MEICRERYQNCTRTQANVVADVYHLPLFPSKHKLVCIKYILQIFLSLCYVTDTIIQRGKKSKNRSQVMPTVSIQCTKYVFKLLLSLKRWGSTSVSNAKLMSHTHHELISTYKNSVFVSRILLNISKKAFDHVDQIK